MLFRTCPSHSCYYCPDEGQTKKDLFRCVRCPQSFHANQSGSKDLSPCLPAGTFFLGGKWIICPNHFKRDKSNPMHRPVHSNHCFVCNGGGVLGIVSFVKPTHFFSTTYAYSYLKPKKRYLRWMSRCVS